MVIRSQDTMRVPIQNDRDSREAILRVEMEILTREEFKERFGTSTERRVELHEVLDEWLEAVLDTGAVQRVWIFGSYTSSKPGPGDRDILAQFASDFDTSNPPSTLREWLDHERCHELHEIDSFLQRQYAKNRSGSDFGHVWA